MATGSLVYKVDDRSILLPYYRRYVVDPFLPLIPAKIHPNSITHAGHLLNLLGTVTLLAIWPERGWPFATAMLLLQAYMWCDNADGAHARRTNQCSPFGEFLDHGLDQLNTVYIAYLTAMSLGVSPIWWVIIAIIIPGAGAVTYWEQSQTGVFRLGLLNQVESLTVLSITLCVSAAFGNDIWGKVSIGPVTLRAAILAWSTSTILFGKLRGMWRVARHRGPAAVIPILGLLAFGGAVVVAAALGAVSTIEAVSLGTGLNVYFGMRMLATRLHGETPRIERLLVAGTAILLAVIAWHALGYALSPLVGPSLAIGACVVFGLCAIADTRRSISYLAAVR
jgi:phosphatidylglycerophosphate synthase